MKEENGENSSHVLSEAELQEIYDTQMVMGIIFKGRISKLSKIIQCLDDNGCYLVFRKISKENLVISVEKRGDTNEAN